MPKRMFAQGEFDPSQSDRDALAQLMKTLDDSAAGHGMAVVGEIEISGSDPHPLTRVRVLRLEADVVTR